MSQRGVVMAGASASLEAGFTVRRGSFSLALELSVPSGTTAALLGPNGAGKSTALTAIAGLLPIDSGRIGLAGVVLDDPASDVFVPAVERRVGVVFQDRLLFPHLTAVENVAFGLRSRGVGREEARGRSREWLARLGLEGLDGRKPRELSGGQAQRVAMARALAADPRLLLLDEPLAALDVTARAELRRMLETHLGGFEGPRLLITHDPVEAFQLADTVHVIEGGRVTQTGSPDDIRLRPRTPYAADLGGSNLFTGTASGDAVDLGTLTLQLADDRVQGAVRVTIRPMAVSVHRESPRGSQRNRWRTAVERVEDLGSRVRILTGPPLPLVIEMTRGAVAELALRPGVEAWVAVKATDIGVEAAAGAHLEEDGS